MNVKKKRNRIFGACILLMMAILAVGTVTFTAAAEDGASSSYSLVIKKLFDFPANMPAEVKAQAEGQEYTFKVTGTRINEKRETVPVDFTFTLPRTVNGQNVWESETYTSGGPFNVTVTELTDNIDIYDNNGNHYNMSNSSSDANILLDSRKHELQLRNNSVLTIERPSGSDADYTEILWYYLTNSPYEGHTTSNYVAVDEIFSLKQGESKKFEKLCAAVYTVEQIAAPDGYQVQMGERTETVAGGNEGHFNINGTPGTLTLTAGGTPGDGVTHYYVIDRTQKDEGDTSEFVKRTVSIASGESHKLDNLPRGGYTVTEYSFIENANTAFSVTMPQTTENKRSALSSAPQYTNFRSFTLTEGTTYIKLDSFGPLYDKNKKKINDTGITYKFDYGVGDAKGNISTFSVNGNFNAKKTYTLNNPGKRYPKTPKIGFRTKDVSSSTAQYIGVSWTEYFEKEVTKTCQDVGKQYADVITIDDRGWMTVTAPDPNPDNGSSQIIYYYTIRNNKDKLITGVGGTTDKSETTVMLKAGESITLNGLAAGSYKITETVEWKPVGFNMKIEGYPFGTTEAGKQIKVKVGGERTVTISKPALGIHPNGSDDMREYAFSISGGGFSGAVTVKAGESGTVTLPKEGEYTITPQKDVLGKYNLNYKDSGAIYGTSSGSHSEITFTNFFTQGAYGYRFVHEYYVRENGDSYTYEGNSQIGTRMGLEEDNRFQALDINHEPNFNQNEYMHFDEAYGWVDPISQKKEKQAGAEEIVSEDSDGGETEEAGNGEEGSSDSKEEDTPGEDYSEPSESEEGDSPGEDYSEPSDSEEGDTPGKDDAEPSGSGKGDTPREDDAEPSGSGEGDTSGKDDIEPSGSGETDSSGESTSNPAGSGGADSSGGDTSEFHESGAEPLSAEGISYSSVNGKTKSRNDGHSDAEGMGSLELLAGEGAVYSGILNGGVAPDSHGISLNYAPVLGEDHIPVTTDASRIIILRYYRERQPEGNYNVIHVYYYRDENGDHWEGTSGVLPQKGELGIRYTGQSVDKVYSFQPADADQPYVYTWDKRPQYGVVENTSSTSADNEFAGNGMVYRPNNAWTAAEGTQEENQIIILRYYREPGKEGKYNIIHEYYVREAGKSQDDDMGEGEEQGGTEESGGTEEGTGEVGGITEGTREAGGTAEGETEEAGGIEGQSAAGEQESSGHGRIIQPQDDNSQTDEEDTSGEDVNSFAGTLNRSRNDGYVYTFEGNTEMETVTAPLGSIYTAGEGDWKPTYKENTYTYIDAGYGTKSDDENYSCNPNQQWAASSEQGDDVIILRYYREAEPEADPTPTPIPEPTPEPAAPAPEPSENEEQITTINLTSSPGTGDEDRITLSTALAAGSLCGIAMIVFFPRKRLDK